MLSCFVSYPKMLVFTGHVICSLLSKKQSERQSELQYSAVSSDVDVGCTEGRYQFSVSLLLFLILLYCYNLFHILSNLFTDNNRQYRIL